MDVLTLCAVIVTVGGALGVIWKWLRPVLDMSTNFKKLEEEIQETKKRDDRQDELLQQCTKGIYFLLKNVRTHNCFTDIEEVEKEFYDIIYNKK